MYRPRFPFWIILSLAIMLLFRGNDPFFTRLQNNWLTSLILIAVSFLYNGRFGYFRENARPITVRKRTSLQIVGVAALLLGISLETFFSWLPTLALTVVIVVCAMTASTSLFYSFSPLEGKQNIDV